MPTITDLEGPAGPLEAILDEPSSAPRAAAVFAHPHPQFGGTMHTKAVYQGAKGLTRIGCAVLRFNFRGVGRSAGTFANGEGEADDFRAALDYMAQRYPGLPLWSAGFSFGAWIALETGAVGRSGHGADRHRAAGRHVGVGDELLVSEHAREHEAEVLRAGGSRRGLPARGACGRSTARLEEPKELVVIDAADHLFDGKTQEVGEALEDLLGDFADGTRP